MVDAFTWQKGSESRTFSSRNELYDYMIERGDVILEGDDKPKFEARVNKHIADASSKLKDKANGAKQRMEE